MATLRIEFLAGYSILSCEECGWVGNHAGKRCIICRKEFNRVRLVTMNGETVHERGSDEDPYILCKIIFYIR
jgi:hypothetical protein